MGQIYAVKLNLRPQMHARFLAWPSLAGADRRGGVAHVSPLQADDLLDALAHSRCRSSSASCVVFFRLRADEVQCRRSQGDQQAGVGTHLGRRAGQAAQLGAQRLDAAVLANDGEVERPITGAVPHYRGLTMFGGPESGDAGDRQAVAFGASCAMASWSVPICSASYSTQPGRG